MNYQELYKAQEFGILDIGVKIEVASSSLPDLKNEKLFQAALTAHEIIKEALTEVMHEQREKSQARRKAERAELIGLFPSPIYVEEIPNGYCSRACCKHLPWFIVTTEAGRIKIGWRKRVINIDWSDTTGTKKAEELFRDDQSTKGDRYIHAWSLEDAARIITRILNTATTLPEPNPTAP